METRGERLRRLRKQLNMTVTELAQAAHCSRALITRMEAEERGRSADKYPAIAKALGCRIDDLFPEMDEPETKEIERPVMDKVVPALPAPAAPPAQMQDDDDDWLGFEW